MADDRIDIEIVDKVAPTIRTNLEAINAAALQADASIVKLRADLATLGASGLTKLRADVDATSAALAKQALEQAKVELANNRSALAAQKLATETARTAKASVEATVAADKLTASQAKQAAAAEAAAVAERKAAEATARTPTIRAGSGIAPGTGALFGAEAGSRSAVAAQDALSAGAKTATRDLQAQAAASDALVKRSDALLAATDGRYRSEQRLFGLLREADALKVAGAISDAEHLSAQKALESELNNLLTVTPKVATEFERVGKHAALSAGNVKEFGVVAREIGRGDTTRLAGSLSILASNFGLLIPIAAAAGAAFSVLFAARRDFNTQTEQDSLKKYAQDLGLTEKEMRKLSNTTVDARGELKSHNVLQITYKDTLIGLFKASEDTVKSVYNSINANKQLSNALAVVGSIGKAAVGGLLTAFIGLSAVIKATGQSAVTFFSSIGDAEVKFAQGDFSGALASAKNTGKAFTEFGSNVTTNFKEMRAGVNAFYDDFKKRTEETARGRIKESAEAIIANRNPKRARTRSAGEGSNALDPLDAAVNKAENDSIILRSNLTKADAAIQRELLEVRQKQVELQKGPLNAAQEREIANLAKLLTANEAEKKIQDEMRTLRQAAIAPQEKYNLTIEATNRLMEQDAAHKKQYIEDVNKAKEALREALDPMTKERDLLAQNAQLRQFYGQELRVETELQRLLNAQLKEGKIARDDTAGQTAFKNSNRAAIKADATGADVKSAVENNPVVQQALQNKQLLEQARAYQAELSRLEKAGVLTHRETELAKLQFTQDVWRARHATELDAYKTLADLQSSSSKELQAIGKAAAIVQATIDGVQAVQKALASSPPPFNFAIAAVVGAAAAANVAKIAGFERGGFTGSQGRSEIAGVVHGQEFVVNAEGTRRNRQLLELMNAGGTPGFAAGGFVQRASEVRGAPTTPTAANDAGGSAGGPMVHNDNRTRIVNVTDPSEIPAAMGSAEGERVILNVLRRNQSFVRQVASN